jgi:hypothetical protein
MRAAIRGSSHAPIQPATTQPGLNHRWEWRLKQAQPIPPHIAEHAHAPSTVQPHALRAQARDNITFTVALSISCQPQSVLTDIG